VIELVMDIMGVNRWGIFFDNDHCVDKERHLFSVKEKFKIII
jgi:hypothetical protein